MPILAVTTTAGEWALVGVTFILVLITGYYAWATYHISGSANESAEAARDSAEAAKESAFSSVRSAEAAERGLLAQIMPLVFGHQVRNMGQSPAEVRLFGFGNLPAFGVTAEILQASSDEPGKVGPLDHVKTNPEGEPFRIKPDGFTIEEDQPYRVVVTYYDAMGTGYRTTRHSLLGGQSLNNIERQSEDGEWADLVRTVHDPEDHTHLGSR